MGIKCAHKMIYVFVCNIVCEYHMCARKPNRTQNKKLIIWRENNKLIIWRENNKLMIWWD